MENKITQEDLIAALRYTFEIKEDLYCDTDLSLYIRDSIDLGELLAVIKNKHQVEPKNKALFMRYKKIGDVLKVINDELTD